MRYELTDGEWATIKLLLPNKPRGVTCDFEKGCQAIKRKPSFRPQPNRISPLVVIFGVIRNNIFN
jgi:hypothetical protein